MSNKARLIKILIVQLVIVIIGIMIIGHAGILQAQNGNYPYPGGIIIYQAQGWLIQ